jgi:hypothetical protein
VRFSYRYEEVREWQKVRREREGGRRERLGRCE